MKIKNFQIPDDADRVEIEEGMTEETFCAGIDC
jgi:hypothetical protein